MRAARGDVTWERPHEAFGLLLRGRTTRTAVPVAALVGTVLSTVNQGGVLASGEISGVTWVRVAVNYCVPFLVASTGYLSARRRPAVAAVPADEEGAGGSGSRTAA